MILTKLWAALLACLATACLAGMFLLSLRSSTGFSEADKKVIRAVTEAGIAAIAADIQSSPVSMGPSVLNDTRLRDALELMLDERRGANVDIQSVLAQVANEGLLREYPSMSVAIVDKDATVLARTGLEENLFDELVSHEDFRQAQQDPKDALFSATLGDRLHTVKVSRRDLSTLERRIVAIQSVDLGGGSSLRRVLGTSYPAGLVRDNALLGEAIGGAKNEEILALVQENLANVPPDGASQVFVVGQGADARIGAIGRVPGPAGRGEKATVLAVLSLSTAGASQHDLAQALRQAREDGLLAQLNWPALGALLVVALTLCFYFPHLENSVPLRRLIQEFDNVGQGRQAQLYQETYNGLFGDLARAAVRTHEAIRQQASTDEFAGEYDDELDEFGPASTPEPALPPRRKSTRSRSIAGGRRPTGGPRHSPSSSIDLPPADEGHELVERNAVESAPEPVSSSRPEPVSSPRPKSAPLLTQTDPEDAELSDLDAIGPQASEVGHHDEPKLASFLSGTSEPDDELPPPPPPRSVPPPPKARSLAEAAAADAATDRDAYYREIYEQFVKTKTACGESLEGFTYARFARKLEQNAATLTKGDDSVHVQFTVYVKNGAAALKAKVVKA